ncbi:MAG: DUF4259 domain-containing protein [Anaerolineae bacterium]|nr:DUF4259 domain-containing protein [Anaerolineae bacterium]
MGSWGPGNFDNDDARDWLLELVHGDNLKPVQAAFLEVTNLEDRYLDGQKSDRALAAAEVVATLRGYPNKVLPKELGVWLALHPLHASDDLVKVAMRVVVRILRDSELREVRENMGNVPMEWYRVIGDLISRLK